MVPQYIFHLCMSSIIEVTLLNFQIEFGRIFTFSTNLSFYTLSFHNGKRILN